MIHCCMGVNLWEMLQVSVCSPFVQPDYAPSIQVCLDDRFKSSSTAIGYYLHVASCRSCAAVHHPEDPNLCPWSMASVVLN